jgi:hypothetical protein
VGCLLQSILDRFPLTSVQLWLMFYIPEQRTNMNNKGGGMFINEEDEGGVCEVVCPLCGYIADARVRMVADDNGVIYHLRCLEDKHVEEK